MVVASGTHPGKVVWWWWGMNVREINLTLILSSSQLWRASITPPRNGIIHVVFLFTAYLVGVVVEEIADNS